MMPGLLMKYFVLKPSGNDAYGKASRDAMLAYATSIQRTNLDLAEDLKDWVAKEERILEAPKEER